VTDRISATEALQILVNDEIISSGRMREILGMNPEEQRAHWRSSHEMAVCPPIPAEGRRESEGASRLFVRIEGEGKWFTIIDTFHVDGGHTSEIIEPLGIDRAIQNAMREGECLTSGHAWGRAKDEIRAAVAAETERCVRKMWEACRTSEGAAREIEAAMREEKWGE
jgi:hypothetical protein